MHTPEHPGLLTAPMGLGMALVMPIVVVLAAGAALAPAARGVWPEKSALARVHAERRRPRGR